MTFELDARLKADCHELGSLSGARLLLLDNPEVIWFVLVPETDLTEVHELAEGERQRLWQQVNAVAAFVDGKFAVDKLNVGAIGNVVSQLHVHVIGRRKDDYCWPDVVWGKAVESSYNSDQVSAIAELAEKHLEGFVA